MPYSARQLLASLLIALHAVIAACGSGLHAGPGASHVSPTRSSDRQTAADLTASPAEHCPICDYCAQGQLPLEPGLPRIVLGEAPFEPALSRVEAPRPPPLASRSRAPPHVVGLIEPTVPEVHSRAA